MDANVRLRAAGLVALAACAPRVLLPPLPAAGAPLEDRQAAYQALAPMEQPTPITSKTNGLVYRQKPYPFLSLGNGLEIHDPRDLGPAVLPGSATAAAINRYDDRRYYGGIGVLAGCGLLVVGAGVASTGVLTSRGRFDSVAWSGLGMVVGGFAVAVVGAFLSLSSLGALNDAFQSYRFDLAAALGLPAP